MTREKELNRFVVRAETDTNDYITNPARSLARSLGRWAAPNRLRLRLRGQRWDLV